MMPASGPLARVIPRGRVAGIDYGRKRIGVAICDAERILASPWCVREANGDHAADAAFFQGLVRDEALVGFVVGLPLNTDGTPSAMSREVERFGGWLGRATGLPVAYQDERYTSHEAATMLAGVGLSRGQKKSRSDAVAAQLVLRGWMESAKAAPLRLVVGCGYLGERVARRWLARGNRVVATTRDRARAEAIEAFGAEPIILDVTADDPGWEKLFLAIGFPATVVWTVGFDRSAGASYHDVHAAGLTRLLDALASAPFSSKPRLIFASSTGVWGDERGGIVNEDTPTDPTREAGRVLVEAERLLGAHAAGPGTALRFAGLYGPGRVPRLSALRAGAAIAADPDSWLNLIHVDDAAAVVVAVADAPSPRPLYVVANGQPVRRRDWYDRLATLAGAPPPTWDTTAWDTTAPRGRGGDKRVDPSLVLADLGITLEHPDALASLPNLVDA